jgi:glycerol uptake facilitator protein
MVGAFLVWLNFLPHWSRTEDPCAKLACFSTMPAIRNFGANLLSEIIGTFMLVLGVAAISSKEVATSGPAAGLGPYLAGVVVWGIVLSLGGTTGYAINPARDLGPRIVHSLLPPGKKMGSGWGYAIVPVLGPDRSRTRGVVRSACTFLAGALAYWPSATILAFTGCAFAAASC